MIQLQFLGESALRHETCINCMIDVNTGMNRTGVALENVVSFYQKMKQLSGILPAGLHCYDGDRHEKEYKDRELAVKATIEAVSQIRRELTSLGADQLILVMGGSPTFPCYSRQMEQVYFSPGTVVVYDFGYASQFPDLPYTSAAAVLTRVVSHPKEGYFTLDAGYKAISAEQGIRGVIPDLPHAHEAFQSEEHWTFCMDEGHSQERPAIGTILYIIP